MPSYLQSSKKPVREVFPPWIFRKRGTRSSELEDYKRLANFTENLTRELQSLKPVGSERILRLEWLHRVLSLALKEHNEAVKLIPKVDFPLSKPDEAWRREYFDTTTAFLEVCNSLSASISNVEHGHLLAKYAICMLEKHETYHEPGNLTRARKSLLDWVEVVQDARVSILFGSVEHEDPNIRVKGMLNGMKQRSTAKGKGFLEALYGAKTSAILACTALTLGLSAKSDVSVDISIGQVTSDKFDWASSVSYLVERCRKEARESIAKGCNGRIKEIEDVNAAVQKLLTVLDEQKRISDNDGMIADVEELKSSLEILMLGLEKVREKLEDFVRSIITSRSALLADLRASVASPLF